MKEWPLVKKLSLLLSLIIFTLLAFPTIKALFQQLGVRWLYIFLFSFFLSYFLTPIARYIAIKKGVMDHPDYRKIHAHSTPFLGGISIYIAFIMGIINNAIFNKEITVILISTTIILITGLIDDIMGIRALYKLVVQVCATLFMINNGIQLDLFPIHTFWGQSINIFLTLFWIIGITNAFNFFDGMDGLATGLAIIVSFFLGVVAFQTDQPSLGWFSIAIMASCAGFFPYNFKWKAPAEIFLGDAGSTFLGFILSSLAVYGNWSENSPLISVSAPLLIFWIFIFDTCHITIFRIKTGKITNFLEWINYVGRDHLHHRLESLFHSRKISVIFIFLLTICMGLSAVSLRYARNIDALLLILQAVFIVVLVSILEYSAQGTKNDNEV